jgi:hypothetical protein
MFNFYHAETNNTLQGAAALRDEFVSASRATTRRLGRRDGRSFAAAKPSVNLWRRCFAARRA